MPDKSNKSDKHQEPTEEQIAKDELLGGGEKHEASMQAHHYAVISRTIRDFFVGKISSNFEVDPGCISAIMAEVYKNNLTQENIIMEYIGFLRNNTDKAFDTMESVIEEIFDDYDDSRKHFISGKEKAVEEDAKKLEDVKDEVAKIKAERVLLRRRKKKALAEGADSGSARRMEEKKKKGKLF